jgi:hypothetical protein
VIYFFRYLDEEVFANTPTNNCTLPVPLFYCPDMETSLYEHFDKRFENFMVTLLGDAFQKFSRIEENISFVSEVVTFEIMQRDKWRQE